MPQLQNLCYIFSPYTYQLYLDGNSSHFWLNANQSGKESRFIWIYRSNYRGIMAL